LGREVALDPEAACEFKSWRSVLKKKRLNYPKFLIFEKLENFSAVFQKSEKISPSPAPSGVLNPS
jgi:hypothetical protein